MATYNSFYGGRRGASFVLVKRFRTINIPAITDEKMNKYIRQDLNLEAGATISASQREAWLLENCMVYAFQKGGNYKEVNYDEYVMIDTHNKNHIDNGKVYRRGYDYTNDMGGAEYVGQIQGPVGYAPHLNMDTYVNVETKYNAEDSGDDKRKGKGQYAPTADLLPGKYVEDGTVKYNDTIQWIYCSIRDEDANETIAYIGFKFPYLVIDYTANSVSPYYNRSNNTANFVNQNLVDRIDDAQHPYYAKWNISVPKGIKGDTFQNLRVTTVEAESNLQDYTGKSDDNAKNRKILVYDYYHYDKDNNGEPVSLFIGDYNMISNFQVNQYGTVTINYTHNDTDIYQNLFKWIKQVNLNNNTGLFEIQYNYDKTRDGSSNAKENTTYTTYLDWIKAISINDEGTVTYTHTHNEANSQNKLIKWIKDITLDAITGKFTINYNHTTDKDGNPTKYETTLKWLNGLIIANNGTVTLSYTNGDRSNLNTKIKWPSNITIDTGTTEGTGTQRMIVTYNTGAESVIGNPLNYIMKTTLSDNYHLLILHSDPAKRQKIITDGKNFTYDDRNDWEDLGSIKEESGILVGLNIPLSEIDGATQMEDIIDYLNNQYPTGLQGTDLKGKIITVGDDEDTKTFYAFDYDDNTWYSLGQIYTNPVVVGKVSDLSTQAALQSLATGGVWFIVEED